MNKKEFKEKLKKHRRTMILNALNECERLGIKYELIHNWKSNFIFKLSYKKRQVYLRNSYFSHNINRISSRLMEDKYFTKLALQKIGIKTPRGFLIENFSEIKPGLKKNKIKFPLVLKPNNLLQGKGVYVNIANYTEAQQAFKAIRKISKKCPILVEEVFEAETDYRVLILKGKVIACLKRVKPQIIGDGKRTLQELIREQINRQKTKLKIDWETTRTLKKQNVSINSIIPKNKVIYLRSNHNISSGGIGINCTGKTCPKFKKILLQCAQEFSLDLVGADIMCATDITDPKSDYRIIELNHNPACSYVHDKPDVGKSEKTVQQILKAMLQIR